MRNFILIAFLISLFTVPVVDAEVPGQAVLVGVPTLLSGDFAELGQNIVNTVRTYEKYYLRHPLKFEFEDAKISGADGLRAYQKLINVDHVNVLVGATSSNGTMAGASLINRSKTVMLTPVTGGTNVDHAGEWIFRLGNSDLINGEQQAEIFKGRGFSRIALLSEETEYTLDISKTFEAKLAQENIKLVYSSTFLPGTTDFRSQLSALLKTQPQAIFIPTQTGSALALILRQLSQLGNYPGEIHTTFTAADNPDARELARGKFKGVFYLAPAYDRSSPRLKEFVSRYVADHKREPLILFHTAATVDALDLLQLFLDHEPHFDGQRFHDFLLSQVKDYSGLLGEFSLDSNGNADTGFVPARMN